MSISRRALLALIVLMASLAASPSASRAASSFCSPSGDSCYGAKKRDGAVRIFFSTFSFRGRVNVCVTGPTKRTDCDKFRLRERKGIFGFNVRWSAYFPNDGRGTYRVRFRKFGNELGPAVTFRR